MQKMLEQLSNSGGDVGRELQSEMKVRWKCRSSRVRKEEEGLSKDRAAGKMTTNGETRMRDGGVCWRRLKWLTRSIVGRI